MRKILIPIDFSARSLKLAEYAFEFYSKEIVNLILVYPYRLPLWESELYKFSPGQIKSELDNEEFSRAKNLLVNRFYRNIHSIEIELFTGVNSLAFKNFMDHHRIQTAIVPQEGFLDFSHNSTFNPLPLILKNVPEVHIVDLDLEDKVEPYAKEMKSDFLSSIKKTFQIF